MSYKFQVVSFKIILLVFVFGLIPLIVFGSAIDGTIGSTYKYAWGENIGWINFGTTNGNVHITDSGLSGYALSETVGWIYLDDVANDSEGNLSGYAWGENVGYIDFNPTNGGVVINSSGEFTGSALSENIGWIIFDGDYTAKTDWRPASARVCTSWTYSDWSTCSDGQQSRSIASSSPAGCSGGSPTLTRSCSIGGGGGFSPEVSLPPQQESLKVLINNGDKYTTDRNVVLELSAGDDVAYMAISENADFVNNSYNPYKETVNWELSDGDGSKTVYVKFYTQYGRESDLISDSIILDTIAPAIKEINLKDYFYSDEDVFLFGKTEELAEITLHWNKKYGLVKADNQGVWTANLGKLSAGNYSLELIPKDMAGNVGLTKIVSLRIKEKPVVPEPPEQPSTLEQPSIPEEPSAPEEPELPEIVVPEKPPEIITVPEEAPLSMQGQWGLLSSQSINNFVLAPLPKNIKDLVKKFPELGKTFEEVGITKITDVGKLKDVELNLPGVASISGLPMGKLSAQVKQQLPTDVIFAKAGKELIDFSIGLTINEKGESQQKITTISGKLLQLAIKPDNPVETIKGYVVFNSRKIAENYPKVLGNLTASLMFADSNLAKEKEKSVEIEEKLVLTQFEYTDSDGDGIYTAEIQAPVIEGEYEIITVMDYKSIELGQKEIRLITIIDPEGYVYEKIGDKEARVSDATVFIFWLNPDTNQYELWPAKKYQQENPQTTNATGKYSFLVPEGSYYLKVEASGYPIYEGESFEVKEGSGIHFNIELKGKYWWLKVIDWKVILSLVVFALLLYNFYRDRKRNKKIKI